MRKQYLNYLEIERISTIMGNEVNKEILKNDRNKNKSKLETLLDLAINLGAIGSINGSEEYVKRILKFLSIPEDKTDYEEYLEITPNRFKKIKNKYKKYKTILDIPIVSATLKVNNGFIGTISTKGLTDLMNNKVVGEQITHRDILIALCIVICENSSAVHSIDMKFKNYKLNSTVEQIKTKLPLDYLIENIKNINLLSPVMKLFLMITDNIPTLNITIDNCTEVLEYASFFDIMGSLIIRNPYKDEITSEVVSLLNRVLRQFNTSGREKQSTDVIVKSMLTSLINSSESIIVVPSLVIERTKKMEIPIDLSKEHSDYNEYIGLVKGTKIRDSVDFGFEFGREDFWSDMYSNLSDDLKSLFMLAGKINNFITKSIKEYDSGEDRTLSELLLDTILIAENEILFDSNWFNDKDRLKYLGECISIGTTIGMDKDSIKSLYYSNMKTRFFIENIKRKEKELIKRQYGELLRALEDKSIINSLENKIEELSSYKDTDGKEDKRYNEEIEKKQKIINKALDEVDRLKLKISELNSEIKDLKSREYEKEIAVTIEVPEERDNLYDSVNLLDKNVLVISKENFTANIDKISPLFKSLELIDGEKPSTVKNKLKHNKCDLIIFQVDFVQHGSRYAIEASGYSGDIVYVKGKNALRWIGQIYNQL